MKTLSQKLAKNLEYFTSDTKKRCTDGNLCKYWGGTLGIKTKGCFVGVLLPLKTRKWADSRSGMSVSSLINNAKLANIPLPKIITKNVMLMQEFQTFHDSSEYWSKNGLTKIGNSRLKIIIGEYSELNEKDFAKSLAITE